MARWALPMAASCALACSPGAELSILIEAAPAEPLEGTAETVLSTNFAVAARGREAEAVRSRRVALSGPVASATPVRLAATVPSRGQYAVHVDLWHGDRVWGATRCLTVNGVERLTLELVQGGGAVDADEDGWPAEGPDECLGFDSTLADCDDDAPLVHPFAFDLCDSGVDEDCVGGDARCSDLDGDGSSDEEDCDDADPAVHPGADEDCDPERDSNCDGEPRCDADGDRSLPGEGPGDDCDDLDPDVHPGAPEQCDDGKDSDCDGFPSNGCLQDDQDGDGVIASQAGGQDCEDCDPSIRPGAREVCGDGIDQDCAGGDEPCPAGDEDRDGVVGIEAGGTDCDDANPLAFPGAPEACGSADDVDCDGRAGACDGADADGDDWEDEDDCDDADAAVHPGATETCNDVDDDCDGAVDEPDNCIALDTQQNCGACWEQCNGVCDGGDCVCGNEPGCAPEDRCCDDRCVRVATDERNCGGCGLECAHDEECIGGLCTCGDGPLCAPGTACCDGACVDLDDDPDNCGRCGGDCGADAQCRSGLCYCDNEAVNLLTDDEHCGSCTNACETRCQGSHPCEKCRDGECVEGAGGED